MDFVAAAIYDAETLGTCHFVVAITKTVATGDRPIIEIGELSITHGGDVPYGLAVAELQARLAALTTPFVTLCTAVVGDIRDASHTEANYSGYARKAITMGAVSGTAVSLNTNQVQFAIVA